LYQAYSRYTGFLPEDLGNKKRSNMSVIVVKRSHELSHDQAKAIAEEMVVSLAQEFGVKYHWEEDVVRFKGAGASGHMNLLPKEVELRMELGFLLRPLKSKIEASVIRRLEACLQS